MTILTDFYKGDTVDIAFVNPDTDNLDISGKDIVITFKRRKNESDEVAFFQSRVTVPSDADSINGIHNYQLSSEDTALIRAGNVFYDIRLVDTSTDPDIVTTIENDNIRVTENVSDLFDPTWTPPFTSGYLMVQHIDAELGTTSWQSASGTPAEILASMITVDGTGSGLDADLLDGEEGSFYAPQATTYTKVESDAITDLLAPQATTYTKVEVDNIADAVVNGIDRKESVTTFADIATTYPSPDEGWTVAVNDEDAYYMYTQGGWINIANVNVPLASAIIDGKMSAADFILFHSLTDASRNIEVESIEFPNASSAIKPFIGYFGDILRLKSGNDGASSIWLQGEQTSFRDGPGVEYLYVGYDSSYTNFTGSTDKAIRFASDITDASGASAGFTIDNQNATTKDIVSFRAEGTEVASISSVGDLKLLGKFDLEVGTTSSVIIGNNTATSFTNYVTNRGHTLVGTDVAPSVGSCNWLTVFGSGSAPDITSGDDNTIIGARTGGGLATASDNTIIGSNINGLASGLTANVIISNGSGGVYSYHDNGSNTTITNPLFAKGGSLTLNTLGTAGNQAITNYSDSGLIFSPANAGRIAMHNTALVLGNSTELKWATSSEITNVFGATDAGIDSTGPSVIQITNGAGGYGHLAVDEIRMMNGVTLDNYASNIMDVKLGSATYYRFNTSVALELASGNQITWGVGLADDVQDVGVKRQDENTLRVTNASSGDGKLLFHKPLINISALHTAVATNHIINCTANTFTVTLPTSVGIQGKEYIIKNSGVGTITVDGDGTETIDGNLTETLIQYESITIVSDGTNWIII